MVVMNLININAAVGNNSRVKVCHSNNDIRRQPPHCDRNLLQDERIAAGRQDSKLPKTSSTVSGQLKSVGSFFHRLKCSRLRIAVASGAFQRRRESRFDGRQLTVGLVVLLWTALPVSAAIGRWPQSSHEKCIVNFLYDFH
jgi:hypothetical protein